MSYDRYKRFRVNGMVNFPPSLKIAPKVTDAFETYIKGSSRLDNISYDYYGDASYDWLILMANPELPALEYLIPNGTVLRIPYPLDLTLENFEKQIDRQDALYGINERR